MKVFQFKVVSKEGVVYPIKAKGFTAEGAWKRAIRKVDRFERKGI